jgi:hypothetical protein
LRTSGVVRPRPGDIDSEQKIIRIVQSKGQKDRHVMLPAEVLKLLWQWWKAWPTAYDAGKDRIRAELTNRFAFTSRPSCGVSIETGSSIPALTWCRSPTGAANGRPGPEGEPEKAKFLTEVADKPRGSEERLAAAAAALGKPHS